MGPLFAAAGVRAAFASDPKGLNANREWKLGRPSGHLVKACLSGWMTFNRFPLMVRLFRTLLSRLVRRNEIFVILGQHAFVFLEGFSHTR